ncbi:hypothetical protein A6A04_16860 [Paramagnetospirillum marisnigri]|uniref:Hemerythrin-like domain-containing protein n=1 Tax=Paramagnetospirillum marisnigri TaxID=1285242 RepID=A0A178MR06_9PROT|nr:hemerythrin family protein [Paramagnetospirillum marisnigri]OAN51097.1 hypothetical protein A6A04_16860 [Paramagnetospirillum marisnigri]
MTRQEGPRTSQAGIDAEHRIQVELILALEQGLAMGRDHEDLKALLRQLVDYTDVHFMSEQMLMRLYSYPALAEHEAAHDKLMEQARRIEADFCSEEPSGVSSELLILKQWLLDHIRSDDYAFHSHLSSV